jgi:hypothetical protein
MGWETQKFYPSPQRKKTANIGREVVVIVVVAVLLQQLQITQTKNII